MKLKIQLTVFLFTLLLSQPDLIAAADVHQITTDTIPEITQVYKGYRVEVKSIKVLKQKGKSTKIEYNLVNTGRNKVKLGKGKIIPKDLIINFDKSLKTNDLEYAKSAIIEALKTESISIRPGQLIMKNKLKFSALQLPPSDRIAEQVPTESIEKEAVETVGTLTKTSPTAAPYLNDEGELPGNFEEVVEEIVEEIPLTNDTINIVSTDNLKTEPEDLDETILTQENLASPRFQIAETETILEPVSPTQPADVPVIENVDSVLVKEENELDLTLENAVPEIVDSLSIDKIVEVKIEEQVLDSIYNEMVVEEKETDLTVVNEKQENPDSTFVEKYYETSFPEGVLDSIYNEMVKEENLEENENEITTDSVSAKDLCVDLFLENVELIKKSKRYVTVEYTIKNIGNAPIALFGKSRKEIDNVTIESHFVRTHNLTRGAIPVKVFYIKKGLKSSNGTLAPNESYTQQIKVETAKISKFTPVLALTVNPAQIPLECSKMNNVFFLDIAEAAPTSDNPLPMKTLLNEAGEEITTIK